MELAGAIRLAVGGRRRFDGYVALGCVVKGATDHYELVAGQAAAGIARVSLDTGVPVIFGVLATDSLEQALERAGAKVGNKGSEAATSAIDLVDLLRKLPSSKA